MAVERGVPSLRYRRSLPPETAGEVYFVQAEKLGLIKIGLAASASDRFRTLQVCSPDRLKLLAVIYDHNASALEEKLHSTFSEHCEHGEWFRPVQELLDFIDQIAATSLEDEVYRLRLRNAR